MTFRINYLGITLILMMWIWFLNRKKGNLMMIVNINIIKISKYIKTRKIWKIAELIKINNP